MIYAIQNKICGPYNCSFSLRSVLLVASVSVGYLGFIFLSRSRISVEIVNRANVLLSPGTIYHGANFVPVLLRHSE